MKRLFLWKIKVNKI